MKKWITLAVALAALAASVSSQSPWRARQGVLSLMPRGGATFDSQRERVVMIDRANRTLEWDGTDWIIHPAGPTISSSHVPLALAYDKARGRTVLFASDGSTSEWNGAQWELVSNATFQGSGSARMVYDEVRQRVVRMSVQSSLPTHPFKTFEWDGSQWIQQASTTTPSRRFDFGAAWDPNTNRVLMFGGRDETAEFVSETWAWDGVDWTLLNPATVPPPPGWSPVWSLLATDWSRNRVVALLHQELEWAIWEWDGIDWNLALDSATGPLFQLGEVPLLAWDGTNGELMTAFPEFRVSDVYHYDGTSWSLSDIIAGARIYARPAALAADTVRDRVVLVQSHDDFLHPAFEWDGFEWREIPLATPSRKSPVLEFDQVLGKTVMFGGRFSFWNALDDTWTWDGTSWVELQPATRPGPRDAAASAYDSTRSRLVMFGGDSSASILTRNWLNETWEWDGTDWIQRFPANSPPAVPLSQARSGAMAFDSIRNVCVLYLGANGTWEWDGNDWTQASAIASSHSQDFGLAIAFDHGLGRVVMLDRFGAARSWNGTNWVPSAGPGGQVDSLVWDPIRDRMLGYNYGRTYLQDSSIGASVSLLGQPCTGSPSSVRLRSRGEPILGNLRYGLDSTGLANGVGGMMFTVGGSATTIGPCQLYLAGGPHWVAPAQWNSSGFAELDVPLPLNPLLLGADIACQAVVLDPTGPLLGALSVSNGLRVLVGE